MLQDISILDTASSFFNNTALISPFFFLFTILTIPLYILVYKYGWCFVSNFGWNKTNLLEKICIYSAVTLLIYSLMFGGNFDSLRDSFSTLPFLLAIILFGLTTLVTSKFDPYKYIKKLNIKKHIKILSLLFLSLIIAFSGLHTWWGILLQLTAVICGYIVGSKTSKISLHIPLTCILFLYTVCILMQPEFFRFGQLGSLTFIHLIFIMITGMAATSVLTINNIHNSKAIRNSLYTKIKWLLRILLILLFILFILTEAVPIFIIFNILFAINEFLSVKQYRNIISKDALYQKSIVLLLISFGSIIICPIIVAMGIIYLLNTENLKITSLKHLL